MDPGEDCEKRKSEEMLGSGNKIRLRERLHRLRGLCSWRNLVLEVRSGARPVTGVQEVEDVVEEAARAEMRLEGSLLGS